MAMALSSLLLLLPLKKPIFHNPLADWLAYTLHTFFAHLIQCTCWASFAIFHEINIIKIIIIIHTVEFCFRFSFVCHFVWPMSRSLTASIICFIQLVNVGLCSLALSVRICNWLRGNDLSKLNQHLIHHDNFPDNFHQACDGMRVFNQKAAVFCRQVKNSNIAKKRVRHPRVDALNTIRQRTHGMVSTATGNISMPLRWQMNFAKFCGKFTLNGICQAMSAMRPNKECSLCLNIVIIIKTPEKCKPRQQRFLC